MLIQSYVFFISVFTISTSICSIQECYWDGQNITILDDVKITPPYSSDHCIGKDIKAVEYIKNIVSIYLCRILV